MGSRTSISNNHIANHCHLLLIYRLGHTIIPENILPCSNPVELLYRVSERGSYNHKQMVVRRNGNIKSKMAASKLGIFLSQIRFSTFIGLYSMSSQLEVVYSLQRPVLLCNINTPS